jgi:hypothetical protein
MAELAKQRAEATASDAEIKTQLAIMGFEL